MIETTLVNGLPVDIKRMVTIEPHAQVTFLGEFSFNGILYKDVRWSTDGTPFLEGEVVSLIPREGINVSTYPGFKLYNPSEIKNIFKNIHRESDKEMSLYSTHDNMEKVLGAYKKGERIEFKFKNQQCSTYKWTETDFPSWNFELCLYRVKENKFIPKKGDVIYVKINESSEFSYIKVFRRMVDEGYEVYVTQNSFHVYPYAFPAVL